MSFPHPSSFRDPVGHVFSDGHKLFRKIFPLYFKQFDYLHASGLYQALTDKKLLIPHQIKEKNENFIVIEPELISFFSYPYEWSFEALKSAALLTLEVQEHALVHGMSLKDASAYNVGFKGTQPVFIDTLSFDFSASNTPWRAYGQFCRHFLSPLLLMAYTDVTLHKLMTVYLDGIPLDLTRRLLPSKTLLNPFIYTNIHLHSKLIEKYQATHGSSQNTRKNPQFTNQTKLVHWLKENIKKLSLKSSKTEWADYHQCLNYSATALSEKEIVVTSWIKNIKTKRVWDMGCNIANYSQAICRECPTIEEVVATDIDALAINQAYRGLIQQEAHKIYPLIIDITSPSPGIGFENIERTSFIDRLLEYKVDCTVALAIIHHLTISNNIPFGRLSSFLKKISPYLLIEFVGPQDSWAAKLLNDKRDAKHLFSFYSLENFKKEFSEDFKIVEEKRLHDSHRTLFLMRRK